MANVFVEQRQLVKGVSVTWDMAHHLYARFSYGQVVIVSEKPAVLMAALRKQWLKVMLKLRNEYSRTLDARRKARIRELVGRMQRVPFTVGLPPPEPAWADDFATVQDSPPEPQPSAPADAAIGIFFILPEQIDDLTTTHRTIYTVNIPAVREVLKSHLVYHGLLVEYEG